MDYQTLYRRWRPGTFKDFVGQNHVVTTLFNAIESDRVAHAYLFTGPRGTGKTSIAKIFAKAMNCLEPAGAEPCDRCSNCRRITDGIFMDVIEIDAASNRGIDEIRDLREKVRFAPAEGKYKIYIIDEVHMLTTEAFNALLKTLEEPPKFVVFILATTEVQKIPATILSRCQRFDFKRFTVGEITGRLIQILTAEGATNWSEQALQIIATYAEGGMRDAIGLLEQALAHSQGPLDEENVRTILGLTGQEAVAAIAVSIKEQDTVKALQILSQVNQDGKDLFQFGRSLVSYFRDRLLEVVGKAGGSGEQTPAQLVRIIETLANAANEVKKSQQSSLPLELALIKLTSIPTDHDDLEARVARLESLLKQTSPVPVAASAAPIPVTAGATTQEPPVEGRAAKDQTRAPQPDPGVPLGGQTGFALWPEFLEAVKQKKRTLAALIQEGKPLQCDGGQLVVGLSPNLKFHLENLALPQNRELLESILEEVSGTPLKISCIPWTEGQVQTVATGKAPVPADPLTKAMALFGGDVQPVKKEDK